MQSDQVYQLPISNIAYHVYNPEDDLERMQAISRRAMQRTLDSYHEHEHLADLFQVELEKREQQIQERKRLDQLRKRELKARSKKTTVPTAATPPAPQAARRHHLRNSSSNSSMQAAKAATLTDSQGRRDSPSDQKRRRRLSDLSTSDISGCGEDEWRSRLVPSQSDHLQSSSGRQRSASSSPAAFSPSSRQSPFESSRNGKSAILIKNEGESSLVPAPFSSEATAAGSPDTLASPSLAQPSGQTAGSGRRKRKQAIPVHPSIVARIPGITLRMQREHQGDQMQVEILKDLSDYSTTQETQAGDGPHSGSNIESSGQSPDWNLQAKQDIRKVKESIDSARFGYASYAPPSASSHPLPTSSAVMAPSTTGPQFPQHPFVTQSPSNMSSSTFDLRELDLNQSRRRSFDRDRDRHLSNSTDSLAWTGSNANSTGSLNALVDPRVLPLTWENFSTRECTVNKVVGKHNQELEDLEEAVQETISRQYYTQSSDLPRPHRLQPERENRSLRRADATMPSDSKTGSSPSGARASNSAATSPTNNNGNGSDNKRTAPTRATRSRTHIAADERDRGRATTRLVAHDDIELILKKKRQEKMEERRRQSSKEMSNDLDDDSHAGHRSRSRRSSTSSSSAPTPSRSEASGVDVDMEPRSGLRRREKRSSSHQDDDELENERNDRDIDMDGDVLMRSSKRSSNTAEDAGAAYSTRSFKGNQSATKSPFKVPALPTSTTHLPIASNTQRKSVQSREDNTTMDSSTATSSDEHDDADDDDYRATYRSNPRKQRRSVPLAATKPTAKQGKSISPKSAKTRDVLDHRTLAHQPSRLSTLPMIQPSPPSTRHLPVSPSPSPSPLPLSPKKQSLAVTSLSSPALNKGKAAEHVRRTKKSWNHRGRNTRKEDEVVDTTSDDSEDENKAERLQARRRSSSSVGLEDRNAADSGPVVPHIQTTRTPGTGMSSESTEAKKERNAVESVSTPISAPVASDTAESGGRTRARARSFSSSMIKPSDKTNFFESALEVIEQKRRETLAKRKAAAAHLAEVAEEEEAEKKRKEETLALEKISRAEKSEASNLPKSSKSLPGRVLRRSHHHPLGVNVGGEGGAGLEMEEDPDCTSCRMELSSAEKAAWRTSLPTSTPTSSSGQESDKSLPTSPVLRIQLPKTWGSHAILCSTCRAQYLEHHMRCTACFYVPSQEELASSPSNCSRCKAGTWLREVSLA
ncbi:hypothetical protein EMPS_02879 [Entomortierella parvispora]|uniref:Uncharacterized protein n=1 Tax=Entomortierella parvispora TaxID=205924 RepID=A0A9P3H5L7_9FUNG|nr:hypothetical protein EMPS_02879 [Entomortierella parvispora]